MAEERDIAIMRVTRHATEDIARVDFEEDGTGRHIEDTQHAPDPSLNKAMDGLAQFLAQPHLIEPEHHGKIRVREVRLWHPDGGEMMVKLYGQVRPDPHEVERYALRTKKEPAKGKLLTAVTKVIAAGKLYLDGERGTTDLGL